MKNVNPKIEWIQKSEKPCLKFTFTEMLTEEDAEIAIFKWREEFQSKKEESIILIWDCKKMKGYETAARIRWAEALKEMKSQIDKIWLISDSVITKMGASAMGLFSSINIKVVQSESEIKI